MQTKAPAKSPEDRERWAPVPLGLTTDSRLTDREFRLLVYLKGHDLPEGLTGSRKRFVFLSRSTIARAFGCSVRAVAYLLAGLESKGFVTREGRPGKTSLVHLTGGADRGIAESGTAECVTNEVADTLGDPSGSPVKVTFTGTRESELHGSDEPVKVGFTPTREGSLPLPVKVGFPHKRELNERNFEEGSMQLSAAFDFAAATSLEQPQVTKPKTRRKAESKQTLERVQAVIDSLDLSKFRAKYPGLDMHNEHARFSDYYLGGNQSNGKPNWQKWSDWSRAFHSWCRNAVRFNGNRPGGRTPPSQPVVGQLPDLTHYSID